MAFSEIREAMRSLGDKSLISVTIRSIDPIVAVVDAQESLFRFLPERYSSGLLGC
jgi:hypothetical protein